MKKILVFFGVLSCILTSQAQSGKISVGVETELGAAFMYDGELKDIYRPWMHWAAGGTFKYNISNFFSLRTALGYKSSSLSSILSFTDEYGNPLDNSYVRNNFSYIYLPVLGQVSFGKKVQFFMNVGLGCNFLMRYAYRQVLTNVSSIKIDHTNQTNHFDLSLITGLGVSIPLGKRLLLSFEARNSLGLLPVNFIPFTDSNIKTASKLDALSLTTGLAYRL